MEGQTDTHTHTHTLFFVKHLMCEMLLVWNKSSALHRDMTYE